MFNFHVIATKVFNFIQLTGTVYKKILISLPDKVLPYLSDPLVMSDWLVSCYDHGRYKLLSELSYGLILLFGISGLDHLSMVCIHIYHILWTPCQATLTQIIIVCVIFIYNFIKHHVLTSKNHEIYFLALD